MSLSISLPVRINKLSPDVIKKSTFSTVGASLTGSTFIVTVPESVDSSLLEIEYVKESIAKEYFRFSSIYNKKYSQLIIDQILYFSKQQETKKKKLIMITNRSKQY